MYIQHHFPHLEFCWAISVPPFHQHVLIKYPEETTRVSVIHQNRILGRFQMIGRWETFRNYRCVSWEWNSCRWLLLTSFWIHKYLPQSTAFIYVFLRNHSQTLRGTLPPTVASARTWDYEVQSENLGNPQLDELWWRNNKEIIKDHHNQKSNTSYKSGTSQKYLYGFVKVLGIGQKR